MSTRITPVPTDTTKYIDCPNKLCLHGLIDENEVCPICHGEERVEDQDPTEEKPFFEPERDFY